METEPDILTCNECGQAKPRDDFYPYRLTRCKTCCRTASKKYKLKNPDGVKALYNKRNWQTYGIGNFSELDRESLYRKQGGLCALCDRPGKLYVDHDHETGKVRGLLCNQCNLQLGGYEKMKANPRIVEYMSQT